MSQKLISYIFILFSTLLVSCQEKDIYEGPDGEGQVNKEDFFDFSTTRSYTLDIDYGLKGYAVMFDLYSENPLIEEDGVFTKTENVKPLYRAATNQSGKFTGDLSVPAYVDKLYLYCPYLGTIRCVELAINGKSISFNQKSYINTLTRAGITTRATTVNNHTYPDGYKVLGDWNGKGRPDYLLEAQEISADFITRLTHVDVKKDARNEAFAQAHKSTDIVVTKATKLSCVIIDSKASKGQTVGYFTYPTGSAPTKPSEIKNPIIAFPAVGASHVTVNYSDEVALRYWNEEKQAFEDEFPAGVSVSFFYMHDSFDNKGNIEIQSDNSLEGSKLSSATEFIFYSNSTLNQKIDGGKDAQRTVTMYDSEKLAAICFETDIKSTPFKQGSWDYTDVIMAIRFSEPGAIDPQLPTLPEEPEVPSNDNNKVEYYGSIAFEDLWPNQGDYDMNDLGIYYNSTVYKDVTTNHVIKIVDVINPANNGATFTNGFGYQFHHITSGMIKSVKIESEGGLTSAFMKNQMLEPGQEHPTIILFDDMMKIALDQLATFTVTIEFNSGVKETDVIPPYNPFIVVKSNTGRGHEVHLTNYPPTTLANRNLLGTGDDKSDPEVGLYYVSTNNFPFAIHLDRVYFDWPEESVRIDKTYPDFTNWAKSKGTSNTDWYVK